MQNIDMCMFKLVIDNPNNGNNVSLAHDKKETVKFDANTAETISKDGGDDDEDIGICPICYENVVNVALNPCGHTLCADCSRQLESQLCPMCSQEITKFQKIFLS